MDSIAAILHEVNTMLNNNGIGGTFFVLISVVAFVLVCGYIIRDIYVQRRNNGVFGALVATNNKITELFEKQISINQEQNRSLAQQVETMKKIADATEQTKNFISEQNRIIQEVKEGLVDICKHKLCPMFDER